MDKKEPKMIEKLDLKTGLKVELPFKEDPDVVLEDVKAIEEVTKKPYNGAIDEYGREIPDPRPMVVDVKPLTMEQKIFNQFLMAHNKAKLELENLPWDMSTPEKAKQAMEDMLNLDMPDETAEFISNYEVMEMAQDWPELPPQVQNAEPAPSPTGS